MERPINKMGINEECVLDNGWTTRKCHIFEKGTSEEYEVHFHALQIKDYTYEVLLK